MSDYLQLPNKITDRKKGQKYMRNNEIVIWDGKSIRLHCECGKVRPNYNYEGETIPICCGSCKKENMVDVKGKKCECRKARPNFNYEGETTAICCASCKKENMVDVVHKRCECGKAQPNFNYEGETIPICCGSCKKENMVDVKSKKCECRKAQPNFNYEGETTAICCASCKKENMVDVKSKKCECRKAQPTYNYEGETTPICCISCKKENMVDVKSKKCECRKAQPTYNYEGETTAICCASCRKENMVDVKNKKCETHLCSTQVYGEKYEGYCLRCFIHTFPDKPVARNYKTKEYAVEEYITQKFPDYTWIADKQIQDGCSKKRPDLLLDLGFQIVNIETDENNHNSYDCSCENKRIMQLSQDVGHRPIVFIRFNPDGYTKDGNKITSCWEYNKQGICVLNKSKQTEWEQRLETLKNQIIYWSDESNITDKTIETIQLFYDE